MKVGIVGGNFSPVHKGHWKLFERASKENDRVQLFASTKGRGIIDGNMVREVWERFLTPFLPVNVRLEMVDNPIRRTYELLGEANETGAVDHFAVYSDPVDILERFPIARQKKYFNGLTRRGQVRFIGIDRVGEMDVSGTQARKLLQHGMRDAFIQLLPEGVDGGAIYDYLLLKSFVRDVG